MTEFISSRTLRRDTLGRFIAPRRDALWTWEKHGKRLGSWIKYAACSGSSSELFFADLHERSGSLPMHKRQEVEDAKAICCQCPVMEKCLRHALSAGEVGIWGATTTSERQRMRHHA